MDGSASCRYRNVNLLISALSNKLGLFGKDGVSNAEDQSKSRSGDWEKIENGPKKGHKINQPSLSVVNHSQALFKMEAKVDIKPYQGEIDALKLNHWLHLLEVYCSVYHIEEEQKISFA